MSELLRGDQGQEPRCDLFHHGGELSRCVARRNAWEGCSSANPNIPECAECVVRRGGRVVRSKWLSESPQFRKIHGVADREASKCEIEVAEDLRNSGSGEGPISWAVAWVLEQLGQKFPEHLVIDRTEDTQQASSREEIEKRSRADDLKLPGWKEEGTISVQHFERPLTLVPDLSGRTHGPAQLLFNDWPGKPPRIVRKRRCCRGPAGDHRVSLREQATFLQ